MKSAILSIIFSFLIQFSWGQYTLEIALDEATKNAQTAELNSLNTQISSLKTSNLQKRYLPQLGVTAQATYQSEVTSLPIELPGIEVDELSKDQYKIQGEVHQLLYDGGQIAKSKSIIETGALLENLSNEVNVENLKEQVIIAYFGILELEKKEQILSLKKDVLNANLKKAVAAINNGVMLSSQAYELQAGIIQVDQEISNVQGYKSRFISILRILTGNDFPEDEIFAEPASPEPTGEINSNKPVLKQFMLRKELVALNQDLTFSQSMPKASLFLNAGYGRPALNFLDNSFQPYAIGGVRVAWNLNNLYTRKTDLQINQLELNKINKQQKLLEDKINIQASNARSELRLQAELMSQDKEIYDLRSQIRTVAESQFENGTITSSELLQSINDEAGVLVKMEIRKIQIKKQQYLLDLILN